MTVKPNLIALLTDEELGRLIPESLKEAAWQRHYNENGNLTFSQRTWGEMIVDEHYLSWYGPTQVVEDGKLRGVSIGKRHVVKGRFTLSYNIEALSQENFLIIKPGDLNKFLLNEL